MITIPIKTARIMKPAPILAVMAHLMIPVPSSWAAISHQSATAEILFDQSQFWEQRQRGDLARLSLERILNSNPTNSRALHALGISHVKEGDIERGKQIRNRLAALNPPQAYITSLNAELKNRNFDQKRLKRARKLQQAGQTKQAIKEYEQLFLGKEPIGPVAVEFYHTLSSMPDRRDEAITGLETLLNSTPDNEDILFTLAQVLTYQKETRRRGLDLLKNLSDNPDYREKALEKYGVALSWLEATLDDEDYFKFYLQYHPEDESTKARLHALNFTLDPNSYEGLLTYGFQSLEKGHLKKAEQLFLRASEARAENAESLAALAITRQRRGAHGSALSLYHKAFQKDASLRKKYGSGQRSASFWYNINKFRSSDYQDKPAERLKALERLKPRTNSERIELGLIRAETHQAMGASQSAIQQYEQLLLAHPNEERAIVGLTQIAVANQNYRLISDMVNRYESKLFERSTSKPMQAALYHAQGLLYAHRRETNKAVNAFEDAILLDQDNVWLRLAYARFLLTVGKRDEATSLIHTLQSPAGDKTGSRHFARALFYVDLKKWDKALAQLNQVPNHNKRSDTRSIHNLISFHLDLENALFQGQLGGAKVAQESLIGLYESTTDVKGASLLIVDALEQFKLRKAAKAVVRQEIRENPKLSISEKINFARYLTNWKEYALSERVIADLAKKRRLTTQQQMQLAEVRLEFLLARADQAMEASDYADASGYLASAVQLESKHSRTLRMLGQLSQKRGQLEQSIEYYRSAIEVDPKDLWAIKGAVGSALESGNLVVAREVLDSAINQLPREPDVYELVSRVAQTAGETKMAIDSMSYARSLRR